MKISPYLFRLSLRIILILQIEQVSSIDRKINGDNKIISFEFFILKSLDADDFDSMTQHVFFFQDEDVLRVDCLPVRIPITNDDVNEAEQDFAIQLSVVPLNVQNPGRITLSRNLSLAKIIDDDREFYTIIA